MTARLLLTDKYLLTYLLILTLHSTDKKRTVCPPEEKKCPGCAQCIKKNQFCDGIKHCKDGTDEAPYVCSKPCCFILSMEIAVNVVTTVLLV